MPPDAPPDGPPRSRTPLLVAAAAVLGLAVGGFFLFGSESLPPGGQVPASSSARAPDPAPAAADLKPHPQENLPPLQFPGYPMPRPPEVVSAVYKFAAEHPEVLTYVPCFCGCEHSGHRGNEDCFVASRDVNGDVVAWNEHGMDCAVCIDVAQRSMQMHGSGASVRAIRAAIEQEFGSRATNRTPTPDPPSPAGK